MLNVFAIAALCALLAVELSAQLPALSPAHLNPAIAKLASGKTVYDVLTQDLSRENARILGRRDTDFVYVDMELERNRERRSLPANSSDLWSDFASHFGSLRNGQSCGITRNTEDCDGCGARNQLYRPSWTSLRRNGMTAAPVVPYAGDRRLIATSRPGCAFRARISPRCSRTARWAIARPNPTPCASFGTAR